MKVTTLLNIAATLGCLYSQTVDTGILGTVTDSTGAVVPEASITITQPATGFTRTLATSAEGKYEIRYLTPGEYTVEVKARGFRSERQSGIVLQVGQQAHIDYSLHVGEVVETVEVNSAPPLLQTQSSTLGEVVSSERIVNLPLNGRNFADLAGLTPGVKVSAGAQAISNQLTANGVRSFTMETSIDGVTVTDNRLSFVSNHPSLDAIQEVRVQSGNYSAEYGDSAGANVSIHLKSGTNTLHGSAFEFLRNNQLDARGYFRPPTLPKDRLRRHNFGATVTGPILRDKIFFLAAYENQRFQVETPGTNVVMTPAMRRGDFSATGRITDPFAAGAPFPGNVIPANRLNPVSVSLINTYMPAPNQQGAVNYAGASSEIADQQQELFRIDYNLGSRDRIFGHYQHQFRDFSNVDFNPFFPGVRNARHQSLGVQHVHTFSPTLLNEFRFGYWRQWRFQLSTRHDTGFKAEDLGINGLKVNGPDGRPLSSHEAGFPVINIAGFVGMGDRVVNGYPQDFAQTWQFIDNVSLIRSNHSMKMGFDLRRVTDDASTSNETFGRLEFTADIAGNAAAAYMLGLPRTVITPEGIPLSGVRQWKGGFYFQDDWKVTRNLTLNLGVRYDLIGLPRDTAGSARTLRFDLDPKGPILWPEPGQSADLWNNEHWHVAPRVGFAYRIKDRNVIRGGYGIFTTTPILDHVNILQLAPPAAGSVTITNDPSNPIATIDNPVPRRLFPQSPIFNVTSISPDRKKINSYYHNWNFQVSRQFTRNDVLELGYVGTRAVHLYTSVPNWNSPPPGPGDIQSRRPYPQWGRIRMEVTDGNSSYHALQARFEHRLGHGLSLTASYNWSHMIDDSANSGRALIQNPRARGREERGDSLDDTRHRLVAGYVWELPWTQKLRGAAGAVLGGWAVGGIVTLQSGGPFSVTQSGDSQNVDPVNGEARPNLVTGQVAAIPASQRDPALWFNTAAFARSTFQFGNTPRNSLTGAGVKTFDLSAMKAFRMPFSEKHRLEFRSEFFNAFNTPQFANPQSVLGTGTFGRVTATKIDQRQIQLALKYMF